MAKDEKYRVRRHNGGTAKTVGRYETGDQALRAIADARTRRRTGSSTWFSVKKDTK